MNFQSHGGLNANPMINGVLWDGWRWGNTFAPQNVTYIFANDGGQGWFNNEKAALQGGMAAWASVCGISFTEVVDRAQANLIENISNGTQMAALAGAGVFGFHDTPQQASGAHNYTGGTFSGAYALNQAAGVYNYEAGTSIFGTSVWTPNQLTAGGFFYRMMTHELGHAIGLKHPHDVIGGAPVFPGVTGASDLGTNSQNHMFYSIMSYNRNYNLDIDGYAVAASGNNFQIGGTNIGDYGYVKGPMAYDIAAAQFKYTAVAKNAGASIYNLVDSNVVGTGWECIWDSGGTDLINYGGVRNVKIDLRAATLDGSTLGGGMLSQASGVYGGYTIANGAVIENANGGSGHDRITGNAVSNVLAGGAGDDTIYAGDGTLDYLYGGNGADLLYGEDGVDVFVGGADLDYMYGGNGDDYFYGGTGSENQMYGEAGNDVFISEGTFDYMEGGADHNYFYRYAAGTVTAYGGSGIDEFIGGTAASDDWFSGNGGLDYAYGGNGNDTLNGGADNDVLIGENGNDLLIGGTGVNLIWCNGTGNDVVRVDAAGGAATQVVEFFQAGGVDDSVQILTSTLSNFAGYQALLASLGNVINGNVLYNTGSGAQLYLNLGPNQVAIWFQGVSAYSLTASDFSFV